MSGAAPKYYCEISELGKENTKITVIDETRATTIFGLIIVSTISFPILICFTYFKIITFPQFISFIIALIAFFLLCFKFSKSFYTNGLLKDFEKILRII